MPDLSSKEKLATEAEVAFPLSFLLKSSSGGKVAPFYRYFVSSELGVVTRTWDDPLFRINGSASTTSAWVGNFSSLGRSAQYYPQTLHLIKFEGSESLSIQISKKLIFVSFQFYSTIAVLLLLFQSGSSTDPTPDEVTPEAITPAVTPSAASTLGTLYRQARSDQYYAGRYGNDNAPLTSGIVGIRSDAVEHRDAAYYESRCITCDPNKPAIADRGWVNTSEVEISVYLHPQRRKYPTVEETISPIIRPFTQKFHSIQERNGSLINFPCGESDIYMKWKHCMTIVKLHLC